MPDQVPYVTYLALLVIVLAVVLAIIAFDAWAWTNIDRHGTISAACYALARQWPVIPFLVGLIIGHLFWG